MPPGKNQFWFPVEDHRVLFVDNLYVADVEGLTLELHQPKGHPGNPLITGDLPWENNYAVLHGSILIDPNDGLFKAWYNAGMGDICYAVSKDGIEWEKPLDDIFPQKGQNTNIVYRGFDPALFTTRQFNLDSVSVMITPDDPDPQRRYKLFTFQAPMTNEARKEYPLGYGYYIAFSPDGIHWSPQREPVITKADDPHMSDCNSCMYDQLKRRFIAFTKRHLFRPDGVGDQGTMQRVRGISLSEDFQHWTKPKNGLVPDDYDDRCVNFYKMSGFVYEGMYLGLLEIYYSSDDHPSMARRRDVQLISSRDGEHWWRAGRRQPFLSPSGKAGEWDAYMLDINAAGPILRGASLWFYYGGRARHHVPGNTLFPEDQPVAAIGLATLRRDGFVSYDAGASGGVLTTRPILFERGSALHVNAEVRGQLAAEVICVEECEAPPSEPAWKFKMGQAASGFSQADCKPVRGELLDATVRWTSGDLGRFAGQLIILRFHLTDGSFYSFWIS